MLKKESVDRDASVHAAAEQDAEYGAGHGGMLFAPASRESNTQLAARATAVRAARQNGRGAAQGSGHGLDMGAAAADAAVSSAAPGKLPHADAIRSQTGGLVEPDRIPFAWSEHLPAEGVARDGKIAARPGAGVEVMRHEVAHVLGADETAATAAGRDPAMLRSLAQAPQPAQDEAQAAPHDGWLGFEWNDDTCVELLGLPGAQAYEELDLRNSTKLTTRAFERLAEKQVQIPGLWSLALPPQLASQVDQIMGLLQAVFPAAEEFILYNLPPSRFVDDLASGTYAAVDTVDLSKDMRLRAGDFPRAWERVGKSFPEVRNVLLPPGLRLDTEDMGAIQALFPNRDWTAKKPGLPDDTLEHHSSDEERMRERQKLHAQIQERTMAGVPEAQESPHAIVLMGGPGAGKTSTLQAVLGGDASGFVHVGPDDVKEMLPEYQEAVSARAKNAANMVQQESTVVAHGILEESKKRQCNIIYDGTGQVKSSYVEMIDGLKKAGYTVQVVMVHNRVDEALKRTKRRAEETGRFVPDDVVKGVYQSVPKNFAEIAAEADMADLYDNTGKAPVHVWSKSGGEATILDEDAHERFLDEVGQDKLDLASEEERRQQQKAEPGRLKGLDPALFRSTVPDMLEAALSDAPPNLVMEVMAIIEDLDKARGEVVKGGKMPPPVLLKRVVGGALLEFVDFCCNVGLTRQGQGPGLKLLAACDDARVPVEYLIRYIEAGKRAQEIGLIGSEEGTALEGGKKMTFIHGTHSGTAVLVARTTCALMPFGNLLKLGIFPVSGELSAGIKMINSTSISGMGMDKAGFKTTAGYASDPRYRFNLLDAQRTGSIEHARELIEQASQLDQPSTAVELQWDHLRIAIYRRALMDETFDERAREELSLLIGSQVALWAEQESEVAAAHIGYARGVLDTLGAREKAPELEEQEKRLVDLAFPVIFGSNTVKATPRPQGVTGEVGVAGDAALGTDIQVAFTKPAYVELLATLLGPHGIEVAPLDAAYFAFFTRQESQYKG